MVALCRIKGRAQIIPQVPRSVKTEKCYLFSVQERFGAEQLQLSEDSKTAILSIQEALFRLERKQPTYTKIVECRFFAGLSIEETADIIGTSPSTVKRQWTMAKTWLHHQINAVAV